ncbi:MAG: DUF6268 family outer membrane beta-barrel protein [Myxococcota bacterium]
MLRHLPAALALALLAPAFASAQGEPLEIARSEVEVIGAAELRGLDEAAAPTPIEVTTWISRTQAIVPVPIRRGALFVGASYTFVRAVIEPQGFPTERASFHEVGITLGGLAQLNDRWSLALAVAPSYASDFERRSGDAINFAAFGSASVEVRPGELEVGFGLAASYRLGRLAPLPIFEVRWVPRPEATFLVSLPQGLRFSWIVDQRWLFATGIQLEGSRYFIGEPDPTLPTTSSFENAVVSAGVSFGARLSGPLWLEVTGGSTLYRNFELLARSGDSTGAADAENALFAELALIVRVGEEDESAEESDPAAEALSARERRAPAPQRRR